MKPIYIKLARLLTLYTGIQFSGQLSLNGYNSLKSDLKEIKRQAKLSTLEFPVTKLFPCYEDKSDSAGHAYGHYFYQDLYIAQQIYKNKPQKHIDIGSRIDGFVAHVAAFREIEIFDIRPINHKIPNVVFTQVDIMDTNKIKTDYADSISCLHALEHFGLGRYNDPINFEGYLVGFTNITQYLKDGGTFYFSVPMGEQRIEFNAHRVFSLKYLLKLIAPFYRINAFSYVDDVGNFHPNTKITEEMVENNCNCHYGCAIFELIKI